MQTRQKVILVFLVCLSLLQQGVRWQLGVKALPAPLEGIGVVAAKAAPSEQSESAESGKHCELVHVNLAGMAELQTLPGIGPVYAERIIAARAKQPFLQKEDLLRVSGIGEKRLAQIADLICLYFAEDNDAAE